MKKIKDKKKLRALLSQIDPDEVESVAVKNFEDDLSYIVKKLDNLKDSSEEVVKLKQELKDFQDRISERVKELSSQDSLEEVRRDTVGNSQSITSLQNKISTVSESQAKVYRDLSEELQKLIKKVDAQENLKSDIESLRVQSLNRGGSIPLQVSVNSTVANSRYADINIISSGATVANNNTTKKTTITLSGGTPASPINAIQFNNPLGTFAGSSNLVWDNTNRRMGINTSSPTSVLTIATRLQTGTGTISDDGNGNITGIGTVFTTELRIGDSITNGSGSYSTVITITDNTHMFVQDSNAYTNTTWSYIKPGLEVLNYDGTRNASFDGYGGSILGAVNPTGTQAFLQINNGATYNGILMSQPGGLFFLLGSSNVPATQKYYSITTDGSHFKLNTLDDAFGSGNNIFSVTRSGTTVSSFDISSLVNINNTNGSASSLVVTGKANGGLATVNQIEWWDKDNNVKLGAMGDLGNGHSGAFWIFGETSVASEFANFFAMDISLASADLRATGFTARLNTSGTGGYRLDFFTKDGSSALSSKLGLSPDGIMIAMNADGINPTAKLEIEGSADGSAGSASLKIDPATLLATPEVGVIENGGSLLYYTKASVRSALWGAVTGRATAQVAANASVVTYTPTTDTSFIISANVLVTTSTAHNFTVQCAYTDEGNTARTFTFNLSSIAGVLGTAIINTGGAVPYEGIPVHIRVKANTAITIKTAGTFTTVTYNVEGSITQIA